jgi:predicted amidophosphoribosyltransferase
MAYQDKKEQKEKKEKDAPLEDDKKCPDFGGVKQCSKCGATVFPSADICEVCGEWLLEGQCKFCYAPLEPEAKFCSECGNPVEGIECPQCRRLSYFDFCKDCNIPLTRQAQEMIEAVKGSGELQSILEALKESSPSQIAPSEKEELEKMLRYKERVEQSQPKRKIFSLSNQDVSRIDKIIQKAQEEKRSLQKQKEDRTPKVIEQIQQKKFTNNQVARRFFGALKILLPLERKIMGWRCNAYNCVHPNGPHECAAPSGGGEWLYDKPQFKEVEI